MRTTPRSSSPARNGPAPQSRVSSWQAERGWRLPLSLSLLLIVAGGCIPATQPADLFALSPEIPRHRAMQTRFFETSNQQELLSASAAVLQDLGFQVEESVREVGFLRATKERSAREYGQDIQRMLFLLLSLGHLHMPVDLHQKIAASLITRPMNREATDRKCASCSIAWSGRETVKPTGNTFLPASNIWR